MFSGIRKNIKKDIIKDAIYPVPPRLVGGIFFFGKVGAGKSTGIFTLSQKYHDHPERKYKIVHLWGGDRFEQHYWALPSINKAYWSKIEKKMRFNDVGPKQYKVNFYYPQTRNLPNQLPQYPELPQAGPLIVQSKVFTIGVKDISMEDISMVIGAPSNQATTFWGEAQEKLRKVDDGVMLQHYLESMGAEKISLYTSFVKPLVREGLLQRNDYDFNINMAEELRDQETITVLCLDFVDPAFRLFYIAWFIKKIKEVLDAGRAPPRVIGILQEVSKFFRATDASIAEDKYKIFKGFLTEQIRMGRRGFRPFLDAQSPNETKGMVSGQADLVILGKLLGQEDRESATEQLRKDGLITKKQISDISQLEPGQYFLCEGSKKVRKRYFFLPRTMYWQEGYGSFLSRVWKNYRNTWHNIKPIKDKVKSEAQSTLLKLRTKRELDALISQQKEEKARLKKEEEKIRIKEKLKRKRKEIIPRQSISYQPEMQTINNSVIDNIEIDLGDI